MGRFWGLFPHKAESNQHHEKEYRAGRRGCPLNACARAKLPFSYPRCHENRFRGACSSHERNSDKSKSPRAKFRSEPPKKGAICAIWCLPLFALRLRGIEPSTFFGERQHPRTLHAHPKPCPPGSVVNLFLHTHNRIRSRAPRE